MVPVALVLLADLLALDFQLAYPLLDVLAVARHLLHLFNTLYKLGGLVL